VLEHFSSDLAVDVSPWLALNSGHLLEMLFVLLSKGLGLVTDDISLVAHDWQYISWSQAARDSR
jgi:hypothetical protein